MFGFDRPWNRTDDLFLYKALLICQVLAGRDGCSRTLFRLQTFVHIANRILKWLETSSGATENFVNLRTSIFWSVCCGSVKFPEKRVVLLKIHCCLSLPSTCFALLILAVTIFIAEEASPGDVYAMADNFSNVTDVYAQTNKPSEPVYSTVSGEKTEPVYAFSTGSYCKQYHQYSYAYL